MSASDHKSCLGECWYQNPNLLLCSVIELLIEGHTNKIISSFLKNPILDNFKELLINFICFLRISINEEVTFKFLACYID